MSSQIASIAHEPVRSPVVEGAPRDGADRVPLAGKGPSPQTTSPPAGTAPAAAEPVPADSPELDAAIENIRDFVQGMQRELQFSVDEDSGRTIITVIDTDSGKIIRQIPPEEILQLARSIGEGAFNLIDSRA